MAAIGGALAVVVGMQLIGKSPSSVGPSTSLTASASADASGLPSESAVPSSSLLVEPTPRPNPETGTDLAWERVATFANAKNVSIRDIAAGPGGYVAVGVLVDGVSTELGYEGDVRPAIWHSSDGTSWEEGDGSSFADNQPFLIAGDGTAYVVALFDGDRTLLSRSIDGLNWQPVGAQPIVTDARVWDLAARPDGFGFIALAGLDVGGHPSVWSSPDGATWTKRLEVADGAEPIRLAIGPRGALAVGSGALQPDQSFGPSAWISETGAVWEERDPQPVGRGGFDSAAPSTTGWFAAGWVEGLGIVVWHSTDGRVWAALPAQPELRTDYEADTGSAGVAFAFGGSEYLFGYASCCAFPPQRSYVSADGQHWARIPRDPAIAPVHFGTVVVEGDRVVAIGNTLGSGGLGGTAGVWIGRVP